MLGRGNLCGQLLAASPMGFAGEKHHIHVATFSPVEQSMLWGTLGEAESTWKPVRGFLLPLQSGLSSVCCHDKS